MEIQGVRESDLAEMIELQCMVFRPDGHDRFWQYLRGDSTYNRDQNRVVIVNGRIAATLRVWSRQMRVGATVVRMGGIGGVCTHPDYRGAGYASALMKDAVAYMRAAGYELGVLFSIIPGQFYQRLGWASVPLAGFRIALGQLAGQRPTDWQIEPFDEARDLEDVMALYADYNARQSGSIVRSRAYWDSAPARLRHVLPVMVARQGRRLGGYLNYQFDDSNALILDVAYEQDEPVALVALAHHCLQECAERNVQSITGEIPHRHPLVELLRGGSGGDLYLSGNSSMMLYALNLSGLFQQFLPELQARLDAAGANFSPCLLSFAVNNQQCTLRLDSSGTLQLAEADLMAEPLGLSSEFFWRMLLGETGWSRLEPALRAQGIAVKPQVSSLLACLFPQQEVIVWGPDHF